MDSIGGPKPIPNLSFDEAQQQVPEKCLNKERFESLLASANKGDIGQEVKCLAEFSNIEYISNESGMQNARRLVELAHLTKEGSWEEYCLAWMDIALAHKNGGLGLKQDMAKLRNCEDLVIDTLHGFLQKKGVAEAQSLLNVIKEQVGEDSLDFSFQWMQGLIHQKEGKIEASMESFIAAYLQADPDAEAWLHEEVANLKKIGLDRANDLLCDLVVNKIITSRNKQVGHAIASEQARLSASSDNSKILAFNVLTKLGAAKDVHYPATQRLEGSMYVMEHYPAKIPEMIEILIGFARGEGIDPGAKLGAATELCGRSPELRQEMLEIIEGMARGQSTPLGQKLGAAMVIADKIPEKKQEMLASCLTLVNMIPPQAASAKLHVLNDILDKDHDLLLKDGLINAYSSLLRSSDISAIFGASGKICSILPEAKDQLGTNLLPYIANTKLGEKIRVVLADKMLKEMNPSPQIRAEIEKNLLSIVKDPASETEVKLKSLNMMLKNPQLDPSYKEDVLAVCNEHLAQDVSSASHIAWSIAIGFHDAYGDFSAIDILNDANMQKEHGFATAMDRGNVDVVGHMVRDLGYDVSWIDPHSRLPVLTSASKCDNSGEMLKAINGIAPADQWDNAQHRLELVKLGHVFSINGHPTDEGLAFAGNTERSTIPWVTEALSEFLPTGDELPLEGKDEIIQAFDRAVPLSMQSPAEIAAEVKQDKMSFLPVTIQGASASTAIHAVGIMVGNGYVVKVNRGDHSYANYIETLLRKEESEQQDIPIVHGLEFYKMDESFFNEKLIAQLKSPEPAIRTKAWESINHRNLEYYGRIDKKGQSMGNCTFASSKTGVLAGVALTHLKDVNLSAEENPQWALTHIVYQKADKPYKEFAMEERIADLKAYKEKYAGTPYYDEAVVTVCAMKLLNLAYKNYDEGTIAARVASGDLPNLKDLARTIQAHREDYHLDKHLEGITSIELLKVLKRFGL